MNTRLPMLVALAACAAALTGCAQEDTASSGGGPELPPATASPAASPPSNPQTSSTPKTNERGHISKVLGETGGITDRNGEPTASFSIDKVTVDPPCGEYGAPPDSGRTLLLDVRVATTDDQDAADQLFFLFNTGFVEIGKDGVTRPTQIGVCTDAMASLPPSFGLNQKFAGQIELVVPEASGLLALQDNGAALGWEWKY